MSGLTISPTDIVKGVRVLRDYARATRTDEIGSIARFDEVEQQLSRFKAAIAGYRSGSIPPEVDATLKACEGAIKDLDRKLEEFRKSFRDAEVKRRRSKAVDTKVKFARNIGRMLKEFDEKIARELRTLELWERVHASERQTVEVLHATQFKSIEMKLKELKECIAIKQVSRQTDVSRWSVSEETLAESAQRYSGMTPGRIARSRSEAVMHVIRNDRLRKAEQIIERRHSHGFSTQIRNDEYHDFDTNTMEKTDVSTQIGTALGYIVKGLIGLLDTCVYRPGFSLWNSSLDWSRLESLGLYLDPARPYRNKVTSSVAYRHTLVTYFQNRYRSTIFVMYSPPALNAYNPENDERQWASLHAYSHCRDLNGVWIVDTEYANLMTTSHLKPENYGNLRYNGRVMDPHHIGHVEAHICITPSIRLRLKVKGFNYMERYISCINGLDMLRQKEDLPGHWPSCGVSESDHTVETSENGPFMEIMSPVVESAMWRLDSDNGPWISSQAFSEEFEDECKNYNKYRASVFDKASSTNRFFQYCWYIHSPQDFVQIRHMKGASLYDVFDDTTGRPSLYEYVRFYGSSGTVVTSIAETLFSLFRCEWKWSASEGCWTAAPDGQEEAVAVRHNWDEAAIALVDDLPAFVKTWVGIR